jgi:hypothetical protein
VGEREDGAGMRAEEGSGVGDGERATVSPVRTWDRPDATWPTAVSVRERMVGSSGCWCRPTPERERRVMKVSVGERWEEGHEEDDEEEDEEREDDDEDDDERMEELDEEKDGWPDLRRWCELSLLDEDDVMMEAEGEWGVLTFSARLPSDRPSFFPVDRGWGWDFRVSRPDAGAVRGRR